MISRYDSKCFFCGKPTKAGEDHYDTSKRQSFHMECLPQELEFDKAEAESLAEKLGFKDYDSEAS